MSLINHRLPADTRAKQKNRFAREMSGRGISTFARIIYNVPLYIIVYLFCFHRGRYISLCISFAFSEDCTLAQNLGCTFEYSYRQ